MARPSAFPGGSLAPLRRLKHHGKGAPPSRPLRLFPPAGAYQGSTVAQPALIETSPERIPLQSAPRSQTWSSFFVARTTCMHACIQYTHGHGVASSRRVHALRRGAEAGWGAAEGATEGASARPSLPEAPLS
jgi:hypothetical protein